MRIAIVNPIKFISGSLILLSIPIFLFLSMEINLSYIIVPLVVLEIITIVKKYKELQALQLMVLYLFVYFLYLIPYFFWGYKLSDYSTYQNPSYFNKIAFLFYLFYLGVLCVPFNNKTITRTRLFDELHINTGTFQKAIYAIILLLVTLLSLRQGQNVLSSDNSYVLYKENLDSINSLPLYLILLLVFYPIICVWNQRNRVIFVILLLTVTFFCISRGVRMVLAPVIILAYMVFFEGKLSRKSFLTLLAIGYVFLIFVNALKMNMDMQMSMLFSEGSDNVIISHHADNLYVAASGFGLINEGVISFFDRLLLCLGFISEMIVPPSIIPDEYKFPHIININSSTGGGGLFITGSFLMWGYLGPFLFGYLYTNILISSYVRKILNTGLVIVCIVTIVYFPRWMSYDYHIILKFPFVSLLLLYLLKCRIKY